ncbi:ATP-binding protein [Janthinobacterium lividum]|jgi:two-component system sensor histidine kinase QseC|uniref:histidine kinase n=1 Tax=Janthinobacterium lividum TaxID=29581 RepID=A0AAJ4T4S5_9BURK|nr:MULTISPECIES: ATP-binding protein [Janthinobacterium]KAB0326678.1 sensor histidine kinase [Janthinobacterium lividum]MCC7713856.1 sensor histidine kinase [Janthinobacterium lividum]MDQ4626240.1 ATP-binding protein [Janthinobacterium lividum]MDQ4674793.1 ATP-binding protein [Janthinobacterium lividum]MDQ4685525.1 ATP-binding protein [Janthinobacterium lividum]
MMGRFWAMLRRPTLVRRLMMAQMLMLTVLWSLAVAYVLFEGTSEASTVSRGVLHAIISVADNLAEQPQRQEQSLRAIDEALREEFEMGQVPELAPRILVWREGKLVYKSPAAPSGIRSAGPEQMEVVYIKGQAWRSRSLAEGTTRVTVLEVGGAWQFFVTINSRGYYLLPLLISLPFLLVPAWLSIRLAMRPWRKVAQEVAARGPQDLRPLAFKPPHGELAALVDNINALLQRVDASASRERSFIADATHELRTPLAAMRVNVEALQGQAHDARQQELLDGILNSGNRAARLVGQLLQLTRSEVQAGGGELPRRQALDTLLQDRLAALSGLAQAGDIELELQASVSLSVAGQRESLVSLIDNLVENAIKYSPRGSSVTVSLHAERGQAVLHVADQGPGIAPALYERVFDRFFRAPQQVQPGSGLGLSIVASVVRQHGGTIQLHRGNGGLGLLVEVRLPLAEA